MAHQRALHGQTPCWDVQLAISQILCTPPTDCLSTRKLIYKPGLWHVRGEMLAAHLRVDAHVALRFVPSAQELCDCVISLVRTARSYGQLCRLAYLLVANTLRGSRWSGAMLATPCPA